MKTTKTKLTVLFLALFMTVSCKKEASEENRQTASDQLRLLAKKEASIHNKGMGGIIFNLNGSKFKDGFAVSTYNLTRADLVEAVYDEVNDYLLTLPNNAYDPIAISPEIVPVLEGVFSNGNDNYVQTLYEDAIVDSRSLTTTLEAGMVNQITQIFENAQSQNLNQGQTYSYIKNQLETLRVNHSNTIFNPLEGKLFSGLIEIATEPNEYWKSFNPDPSIALPIHINTTSLIQLDAFGNTVGWYWAVQNDIDNGTLTPSHQNIRIRAGVYSALLTSSGGKLTLR